MLRCTNATAVHTHAHLTAQPSYQFPFIRFVYRTSPISSSSSSSSRSEVPRSSKDLVFRFTVRVADATGEVDTHLFGKEAELFLGVTAAKFSADKSARQRVKMKLLTLCQSQFTAPSPVHAMARGMTTRGSHALRKQQKVPPVPVPVPIPVPVPVPLLTLNLFSYLPATQTGVAAVRLAVVGTSLYQL